jgi:uncharacterized membrane protein required for colicin V production
LLTAARLHRRKQKVVKHMKMLVWIIGIVAVIFLIAGLTVKALGFLLGVAPILLVVAVVLLILNRSHGRRIP